jgi:hypothetical protein
LMYPKYLTFSKTIFLPLQHICLHNLTVTGCVEEIACEQYTRIQENNNSDITVVFTYV